MQTRACISCIAALWIILSGWFLSGCVAPLAPIASFVDPAFRGRTYQRIGVLVDTVDLGWRQTLEHGASTTHVPVKMTTTTTNEQTPQKQPTSDVDNGQEAKMTTTTTTTTTQEGGYSETVLWTRYNIRLIDASTGQIAWMATNLIYAGGSASRFCQEIVAQLQRDGLVKNKVYGD